MNDSEQARNAGERRERRGFASMSPEKQREIASKGGRAAHQKGTAHEWTSEEARSAGRKGGQISRGGRGRLVDGPGAEVSDAPLQSRVQCARESGAVRGVVGSREACAYAETGSAWRWWWRWPCAAVASAQSDSSGQTPSAPSGSGGLAVGSRRSVGRRRARRARRRRPSWAIPGSGSCRRVKCCRPRSGR